MLHRFARVVSGCTVLLVLAGSLVTSTGSGLSVPDWPTSYGWNMLTFPPSKWVGGIFYEHGHRLIATTVGCLTIILAVWLWISEPRRWLKWLGAAAQGSRHRDTFLASPGRAGRRLRHPWDDRFREQPAPRTARPDAASHAPRGARRRAGHARRTDRAERPEHLDQQHPRRLRRTRA